MKYPYLLFDADDTLFDFPKASSRAFSIMCRKNDVPDSPESYQLYHEVNQVLWEAFNRGEVTKDFLTLERYVRFLKSLGLDRDADRCNRDYLDALGETVFPLPHAEEVCRELDVFANAFISEEAGAAKPHKAYYDYIRRRVPEITPENCLVIGDSLATDIRGANNAGLPCCWFNPAGEAEPEGLRIDFVISDLRQLLDIV